MFEFTRQTILNSNTYLGKAAFSGDNEKNILTILGYFKFPQDKVDVVYKREYREGSPASVTFDLTKITESLVGEGNIPGTYRFAFYIGLAMSSQDSFYANNLVYKGKPLYIEFPIKKSDLTGTQITSAKAKVIAERIKSIVSKYQLLYTDEKILDVIVEDDNTITFQGMYDYQIIRSAVLERYNPEGGMTIACCANPGEFEPIITGKVLAEGDTLDEATEVEITPNVEAFGNYAWMIHNLRIPTGYNTRWDAPLQDEAPAVGGKYTQYTFHMNSGVRKGIAGEAVGMGVTSYTTHVFYVADSLVDAFEAEIEAAGIQNIVDVPEESSQTEEPNPGNG